VIDASQRVFDGRPLTKLRPALRLLLVRAERLEQRFLRVHRNRASAAGGRAGRTQGAGLADGGGDVHGGGAGDDRRGLLRGTRDTRVGGMDRKRGLRKPAPIGARPRFGANRDAACVQVANVGTAQVAAIDQQFGERSVRREVWREQGEGLVLGFVGGSDNRADDHIGVHEFDHMALVAGEEPRPRLAAMAHLGITQRRHALRGHAAPNAPLTGRRIRFQVLRQDAPQRRQRGLHGRRLTPSLFTVLGVRAMIGRTFYPSEERAHAVVLSQRFWRTVFGADPTIIDRNIVLDGGAYTIVGVMPAGFEFPGPETEFWLPLALEPERPDLTSIYFNLGRLKEGIKTSAAAAEANSLLQGRRRYGHESPPDGAQFEVVQAKDELVAPVKGSLRVLLSGGGFLLLIACSNVANLLLARCALRRGELALRAALGASRRRLISQLVVESTVLAAFGGLAGIWIAAAGVSLLQELGPADLPRLREISVDRTVLLFTAGVSLVTGVLFGSVPAWQVSRTDPSDDLRTGVEQKGSRPGAARQGFVVAQVALAVVLLVGGGLLVRSFFNVAGVDPGFNPENLLTFKVARPRVPGQPAVPEPIAAEFRERLAALPGVRSVAFGSSLPFLRGFTSLPRVRGIPEGCATAMNRPTADAFSAIPIRRGHFRLESGHHSELWMTLETLCSPPSALRWLIDALASRLRQYSIEVACGPLNEGAFLALMVAQDLGCEFAYAERFVRRDKRGLFPVEYRLPAAQRAVVEGKRLVIVNDVTSAGSAVRGTYHDLKRLNANVVVIGSLLVLGNAIVDFARERNVRVEALEQRPFETWVPEDCPLCRAGVPLEDLTA
jgi:orotate phosphoribosyltransferase